MEQNLDITSLPAEALEAELERRNRVKNATGFEKAFYEHLKSKGYQEPLNDFLEVWISIHNRFHGED